MEKWTDRFGSIWDHKEEKIPGQPFNPGRVQNLKFTSLSPAEDLYNKTSLSDIVGLSECGFISKFGNFESNLFGSYSELRQNVYGKSRHFPLIIEYRNLIFGSDQNQSRGATAERHLESFKVATLLCFRLKALI